jgi:hypothetical protein
MKVRFGDFTLNTSFFFINLTQSSNPNGFLMVIDTSRLIEFSADSILWTAEYRPDANASTHYKRLKFKTGKLCFELISPESFFRMLDICTLKLYGRFGQLRNKETLVSNLHAHYQKLYPDYRIPPFPSNRKPDEKLLEHKETQEKPTATSKKSKVNEIAIQEKPASSKKQKTGSIDTVNSSKVCIDMS